MNNLTHTHRAAGAGAASSIFSMRIEGASMLPEFEPGDVVLLDASLAPEDGDFVVAEDESHRATFRQFRALGAGLNGFELVALDDSAGRIRSDLQQLTIAGVLVERQRRHRAPTAAKLIQIESTCYPHAEAGDLVELLPCDGFAGDGVYALEYRREHRPTWSGLRRMRRGPCGLEIEEASAWAPVTAQNAHVITYLGKVDRVWHSPTAQQLAALQAQGGAQ